MDGYSNKTKLTKCQLFVPLCLIEKPSLILLINSWWCLEIVDHVWCIYDFVTYRFSIRCCTRKPHSGSSLTLICTTGVEGYTHWWTPLHQKLRHSNYWPKWITVGRPNPWNKPLISFYWITIGTFTELHLLCYCQLWSQSNWSHQPNTNGWTARWVDAQCAGLL